MSVEGVLLIAFGGPTKSDEIRPFLANVLRGRPVPPERIEAVVHHYQLIGGASPLNALTFRQATKLERALVAAGRPLPVFVGMRNWDPYLADVLRAIAARGIRELVGIILSPHATESSRDKYFEAVEAGRTALGADAPRVRYLDGWYADPLFVTAAADAVTSALVTLPAARRAHAQLVFTAHSIPIAAAACSPYVEQFAATAAAVAERLGHQRWTLAYQSRSGNPREPWLEPHINDSLRTLAEQGVRDVVVVPAGFVCDHVEVLYDLDVEAKATAQRLGLGFARAGTVNDHPLFIRMLTNLILAAAA